MKTEFDSSNEAWEVYKVLYKNNFPNDTNLKRDKSRPYVDEHITVNGKTSVSAINFGGDTDFNYTKGFAHSRFQKSK